MSGLITVKPNQVEKTSALFSEMKNLGAQGQWKLRHELLWQNAEIIRDYLYSFEIVGSDSSFIENYVNDALARFFNTLDMLDGSFSGKVLEIGGNPYLLSVLLQKLYNFDIRFTNFFSLSVYDADVVEGQQALVSQAFDEEYYFDYLTLNVELSEYPYADEQFDIVLFCEVLEHIVVDPLKTFEKLRNIIRPGGKLILTTPNACRLINFAHMLEGKNFFDRYHPQNGIYGRHNREFTLSEVVGLLEKNGFSISFATTLDRYNYDEVSMYVDSYDEQTKLPWTGTELHEKLRQMGANTEDRGDNIYVVAERA